MGKHDPGSGLWAYDLMDQRLVISSMGQSDVVGRSDVLLRGRLPQQVASFTWLRCRNSDDWRSCRRLPWWIEGCVARAEAKRHVPG